MSSQLVVLEERKRLPESLLWKLQTSFYDRINIQAWSDAIVPNFVTSNAFIANTYARNILAFIRDWYMRAGVADISQPIYIVELGAGHGKMSFLLLMKLLEKKDFFPRGIAKPFKYVMTDFTDKDIAYWKQHSHLKKYMDEGWLDVAQFDAENDAQIKLQLSGEVLNSKTLRNPLVVIANYVFDTLRQDAYRVEVPTPGAAPKLTRALCTVASTKEEEDPLEPQIISRMRCHFDFEDGSIEDFNYDKALKEVMQYYMDSGKDMSILLPIGGLAAMRSLLNMTGGRLFLLAGDKAYNHEEELFGLRAPHVALHGSFSFMVNFHAVALYAKARGGEAFLTPYLDGFKCAGFVFGAGMERLKDLNFAWQSSMDVFGPEMFSTLQRCVKEECAEVSYKTASAVLRMAHYDSDIFYKFKKAFIDRAPYLTDRARSDLDQDMQEMLKTYYPFQKTKDVSFEAARVYMGLRKFDEAVRLFKNSQQLCGEHHISWYNIGLCHYYAKQFPESVEAFKKCLALDPGYDDAAAMIKSVTTILEDKDSDHQHSHSHSHSHGGSVHEVRDSENTDGTERK